MGPGNAVSLPTPFRASTIITSICMGLKFRPVSEIQSAGYHSANIIYILPLPLASTVSAASLVIVCIFDSRCAWGCPLAQ